MRCILPENDDIGISEILEGLQTLVGVLAPGYSSRW